MASSRISAAHVADLERRLAVSEAARIDAETRLAEVEEARARLERLLAQMRRATFGAKSEKRDPDQHNLPFEGETLFAIGSRSRQWAPPVRARWRRSSEAAAGMLAAASEAADKATGTRKKAPRTPEPSRQRARSPIAAPSVRARWATVRAPLATATCRRICRASSR